MKLTTISSKRPIIIREALLGDAPAIARLHVATRRTAYHGLLDEAYLKRLSVHRDTKKWTKVIHDTLHGSGECVYVAEDSLAGIVGFAAAVAYTLLPIERTIGHLDALYVLEAYQGRGIGTRLVEAAATWLVRQGATSLEVATFDPTNARFYTGLGAQRRFVVDVRIGSEVVPRAHFEWPDLRVLLTPHDRARRAAKVV